MSTKSRRLLTVLLGIFLVILIFIQIETSRNDFEKGASRIQDLNKALKEEKQTNKRLSETVKRQSKTVIADEEKQIRETSKTFIEKMFNMSSGTYLKSKQKDIQPLVTEEYFKSLFSEGREKDRIFEDVSTKDIHVYFDTYHPEKNSYKVFVQFDEDILEHGKDKIETRKASVQLDLVRTNDGWLINDLQRFNLQKLGY